MPHLFSDLDDFVPGGLGGLDAGDVVPEPPPGYWEARRAPTPANVSRVVEAVLRRRAEPHRPECGSWAFADRTLREQVEYCSGLYGPGWPLNEAAITALESPGNQREETRR